LSPLLPNFALVCAVRKVQEHEVLSQLNGAHQLLVYADTVSLFGKNLNDIKKNTDALLDASNKVGPEVNAEKTKYIRGGTFMLTVLARLTL
jgi:hypothetical protein